MMPHPHPHDVAFSAIRARLLADADALSLPQVDALEDACRLVETLTAAHCQRPGACFPPKPADVRAVLSNGILPPDGLDVALAAAEVALTALVRVVPAFAPVPDHSRFVAISGDRLGGSSWHYSLDDLLVRVFDDPSPYPQGFFPYVGSAHTTTARRRAAALLAPPRLAGRAWREVEVSFRCAPDRTDVAWIVRTKAKTDHASIVRACLALVLFELDSNRAISHVRFRGGPKGGSLNAAVTEAAAA